MVNYKRVVCEVAVLVALVAVAVGAPADCKDGHYDQRQNGTENFRVHVDGVVVAVMPVESIAESLLDVLPDINSIIDSDDFSDLYQKPKPPSPAVLKPPSEVSYQPWKPEEKPQAAPEKPASEEAPVKPAAVVVPEKPAAVAVPEKPAAIAVPEKPAADNAPEKPAEAPLSDVSLNSNIKSQKKEAMLTKQKRAQRVKNFLASVLMPLLRKNRHH